MISYFYDLRLDEIYEISELAERIDLSRTAARWR